MNEKTIVLKNSTSEILQLIEAVHIFAKSKKISEKAVHEIALSLEEILANIQAYAYTDKDEHQITVILSLTDTEFTAKIIDDGKPFDPVSIPEPDIHAPLEERKVGGIGFYFVRKLMDKMEYQRKEGKNILTVKKIINKR